MRRLLPILALLLSALPAFAQTLHVAVDSSLADAVAEIARGFEADHRGLAVKLDIGAAGVLLEGIAQRKGPGAGAALLVSADTETLVRGTERRLLAGGAPRVLAGNAVVLIVPATRSGPIHRLADLAEPAVLRIALARTASVPAGRHAREAIDAERMWPALQRKVVFADSVAQVLQWVARGEVDAGFVYRTDVGEGVRVVQTLDSPTPVRHAAALVAGSDNEALAREFIETLAAPASAQLFARRGYLPP
jgi:molybdate transport system substrate-binding protein